MNNHRPTICKHCHGIGRLQAMNVPDTRFRPKITFIKVRPVCPACCGGGQVWMDSGKAVTSTELVAYMDATGERARLLTDVSANVTCHE